MYYIVLNNEYPLVTVEVTVYMVKVTVITGIECNKN